MKYTSLASLALGAALLAGTPAVAATVTGQIKISSNDCAGNLSKLLALGLQSLATARAQGLVAVNSMPANQQAVAKAKIEADYQTEVALANKQSEAALAVCNKGTVAVPVKTTPSQPTTNTSKAVTPEIKITTSAKAEVKISTPPPVKPWWHLWLW